MPWKRRLNKRTPTSPKMINVGEVIKGSAFEEKVKQKEPTLNLAVFVIFLIFVNFCSSDSPML